MIHPPIVPIGGRPDWLASTARVATRVTEESMPSVGRRLVKVIAAGELPDAVPVDLVLVEAGDEPPLVYVPASGAYELVVEDVR